MSASDDQALEAAAHWVAVLQGGAPSRADRRALKAWLNRDIGHAAALDAVMRVWRDVEPLAERSLVRRMAPPATIVTRRPARPKARSWAPLGGLAMAGAALALALLVPIHSQTYATAVGQMAPITLPDHSRVWLNTNSRLTVSYTLLRRRLALGQGEAEFQVAHEAVRPFLVSTPNAVVRATGTDFSVRYDDGLSRVVLVQGTVTVKGVTDNDGVRLTAGHGLDVSASGPSKPVKIDPATDLAWRGGRLVFFERPMAEVVREFARYNMIKVRFADTRAEQLKITGAFRAADFKSFLRDAALLDGLHAYSDRSSEIVIASGRS